MFRIREFLGIAIAKDAEHEATFSIDTFQVLEGSLPRRAVAPVREWGLLHRQELVTNGAPASQGGAPSRIAPLDPSDRVVRVKAVRPLTGCSLRLAFTDGLRKDIDHEPYLRGPSLEPLRDPARLREDAVDPEPGTIVWPNGADICPDVLSHGRTPASFGTPAKQQALLRPPGPPHFGRRAARLPPLDDIRHQAQHDHDEDRRALHHDILPSSDEFPTGGECHASIGGGAGGNRDARAARVERARRREDPRDPDSEFARARRCRMRGAATPNRHPSPALGRRGPAPAARRRRARPATPIA